MKLKTIKINKSASLYKIKEKTKIYKLITSTSQTRIICNDPLVCGVDYTEKLKTATTIILKTLKNTKFCFLKNPKNTVILNILRGGLNFGLREALHNAYGWNNHNSAFISSQRIKDKKGCWHISENRYQKIYIPNNADIVVGDVVATGTSLEHALLKLVDIAKQKNKTIRSITFFTIGSYYAEKIIEKFDAKCRKNFTNYKGSCLIYLEGRFEMIEKNKFKNLKIYISGTDLLRTKALLAPEFIKSQNKNITFPLERCTIYDAGSRAFHVKGYLKDLKDYWQQVEQLAKTGMTLVDYLKERYPEDKRLKNKTWLKNNNSSKKLINLSQKQIKNCKNIF